jgi:hypothetical protein
MPVVHTPTECGHVLLQQAWILVVQLDVVAAKEADVTGIFVRVEVELHGGIFIIHLLLENSVTSECPGFVALPEGIFLR